MKIKPNGAKLLEISAIDKTFTELEVDYTATRLPMGKRVKVQTNYSIDMARLTLGKNVRIDLPPLVLVMTKDPTGTIVTSNLGNINLIDVFDFTQVLIEKCIRLIYEANGYIIV